ncbi:FOXM [Acanthosepion pharaonis]|uniref:FOXM n=1 Tax=Acanthosepion pharaonis TaxID=158019 RepID=A0A812EEK3_ACAPH|nr:FOXM [Sepia pharaonis]
MWSKQSRKSPHETLLQPARKKINYAYSGSPDSPHIRRSISRLSNSDDIKRNLRNITDDDYDQGYSAPVSQVNFSRVTSPVAVTTITSSSPCNSIDSGFQSPTGLQSPPSGALSFSLASQLNSQSSPVLLNVTEKSHSLEEKDCELLVTPNAAARVESEFTTPSSAQTPKSDPQFNKRPSHSYEKLIKAALNSRQDKRMTLKEIRQWVENTYPFYKNSPNPGWKDSIRHNLSVSKLFVKESPKYGSYWKLTSSLKEPAMSPQVPSGPLPILPRPSVDPQTYVLVPLQYFCNPSQNNIPLIPQLSSTQNTSGE